MATKAPSKIRPWLVWGSAGLFAMFQFLLQGSPSIMIPDLISTFNIDAAQVGFLTSYFFYSYIVMQIPSGILVDIFGPKAILLIGCISLSTACLVFGTCHHLWSAKSSRLFMGLMSAPGIVCTLTLASRWFSPKRFALVAGFTETLCMVGAAMGTEILALAVRYYNWRVAIIICGLIGYLVALLISIFVKSMPPHLADIKISIRDIKIKQEAHNLTVVFKESQAWICGLFSGLTFAVIPAFLAFWSIPFFMDRYSIEPTVSATIISVGYIGAGVGGPFLGWLSDRIGRRKIIINVTSFISLLLISCIIFIKIQFAHIYFFMFFLGFSLSSYVIPFAIISEILPFKVKGKAMGFANTLTLLIGAPLLQPLIGYFLPHTTQPETLPIHLYTRLLWMVL
ncbi:MAG: hypothetical protein S4CHLAM7_09710 [Chlamydiae bacterium]|nr:hypothetical protein [Chlamydiota bacterium]